MVLLCQSFFLVFWVVHLFSAFQRFMSSSTNNRTCIDLSSLDLSVKTNQQAVRSLCCVLHTFRNVLALIPYCLLDSACSQSASLEKVQTQNETNDSAKFSFFPANACCTRKKAQTLDPIIGVITYYLAKREAKLGEKNCLKLT